MAKANRKLAAILSADVVGYSRLMGADEEATVAALNQCRAIFKDTTADHKGRVVDTAGDSVLAEFPSVVEAVRAAVEVQQALAWRNDSLPEDRRMRFRIGVNLGDVIEQDDGTIYGDGVNIAARLESLAEPGGICVSESAHMQIEGKLDAVFESIGEHAVKNISKPIKAYRLVARGATSRPRSRRPLAWAVAAALVFVIAGVAVWQTTKPPPAPAPEVVAQPKNPILALPTGPSIAVMPFENLSDSSSDDYFAAGLAGDISIQLSYEPNFRIIGRSATQKYRGQTIDVRAIAAELGVTYMLLGSVRRTEDTIRVTAELLEGSDGSQIWAEIFDRQLTADNLFTVQDEIAGRVVGTISDETGVTPRPMRKRAVARNAFSVSSYECVLLGHEFQEKHTQESHALARDCLEKAVRDDPEYADAWGMLSIIYGQEAVNGFNPLPNSLERSLEAGLRGVQANDNSQMAWWGLTAAYYWTHQLEKFIHAAERAVSINPNDVSTLSSVGFTYGMWGMYDKGLPLLEKAIALSPFDVWWYYAPFWMEAFARDDYNAALEYLYKYELPGFQWTYIYFAATYGHLGQTEKAREAVDQLLELRPDIANKIRQECRFWNFPEPVIAKIVDGLRKAGLDIPDEPDTTD